MNLIFGLKHSNLLLALMTRMLCGLANQSARIRDGKVLPDEVIWDVPQMSLDTWTKKSENKKNKKGQ